MNAVAWPPLVTRVLVMCIPLAFGLSVPFISSKRPFHLATRAAYLAGILAVTAAAPCATWSTEGVPIGLSVIAANLARNIRIDPVTRVMLVLIAFLAVVIVRYSRTYLHGDAGETRYARALLGTLAAVTVLVVTNNLLALSLAWLGTSLALHRLLTFYRDRRQALVVAHKKFLLSRLADACMLGAIVLIARTVRSLEIDTVNAWALSSEAMPLSLQAAAVLLVFAVSLKSAQLPFHGWLIQVMEAPTPVSALLHAGIVNMGGFLMIRLAPFMARAPLAQALLVFIGTVTAVIAALVTTTRVSIKVALAWSTCAQMGFMLVECGVGAWDLALLHLVAHSLYKAHAFLGSGTAVDVWRAQSISRPRQRVAFARIASAFAFVLTIAAAIVAAGRVLLAGSWEPNRSFAPLMVLLGLSLIPLVTRGPVGGVRAVVGVVVRAAAVTALYVGGHAVASLVFPVPETALAALPSLIVVVGFLFLFGIQLLFECWPDGRITRRLQPLLFAGLYLDETFSRITFWLWPPRLRPDANARHALLVAKTPEAS